jgi:predicted NodU family carbamoyl transferase
MNILGVNDGLDGGAALVCDDRLVAAEQQCSFDGRPRSRAFPWEAIDAVLAHAGLTPSDIDRIAVAGRFTPPFFLRKHPGLRKVARNAFSPAVDASVFFQAVLRQSGFGAMDADRAAEWLEGRFKERGFVPQRVVLVDVHSALANAAYRTQPLDSVQVMTLHPMGDGVALAVHLAARGQLDRHWEQRGFAALHTHLQRCAESLGLERNDHRSMWALAGRGTPQLRLVDALRATLRAEGPRLSRRSYPLPDTRRGELHQALESARPEDGAASVLSNLSDTVCALVRHHHDGVSPLVLAGAVFDNPRLVADIAALEGVSSVFAGPDPGYASLAIGAVCAVAGLHPRALDRPGLGATVDPQEAERALRSCAAVGGVDLAAEALANGGAVARLDPRGGWGLSGLGGRSVLVRADRKDVLDRIRGQLELSDNTEPALAVHGHAAEGVEGRSVLGPCCGYGSAAPAVDHSFRERFGAAITQDGRAHLVEVDQGDPSLLRLLEALESRGGPPALAVLPLQPPASALRSRPGAVMRAAARAGLDGVLLGERYGAIS